MQNAFKTLTQAAILPSVLIVTKGASAQDGTIYPLDVATDDFLFRRQFGIVDSWFKAGRPVEFHLYQNGGHSFGLGNPNRTSNRWIDAFIHWLDVNKFLTAKATK